MLSSPIGTHASTDKTFRVQLVVGEKHNVSPRRMCVSQRGKIENEEWGEKMIFLSSLMGLPKWMESSSIFSLAVQNFYPLDYCSEKKKVLRTDNSFTWRPFSREYAFFFLFFWRNSLADGPIGWIDARTVGEDCCDCWTFLLLGLGKRARERERTSRITFLDWRTVRFVSIAENG